MKKLPDEYIVKCESGEETTKVLEELYDKDKYNFSHWKYVIKSKKIKSKGSVSIYRSINSEFNDLPIFDFQEWESLLNQPNLSIEYVKNNKVAIHVTSGEEVRKCDELLGWRHDYLYDGLAYPNGNQCIAAETKHSKTEHYKPRDYQIIEAKDFINYNSKNMEKKIIGYKLKESCKQYEKAAVNICKANGSSDISNFDVIDGTSINIGARCIPWLQQAGVLELWFDKVYADEFKVGDYVIVIGNPRASYLKIGDVFQIAEISEQSKRFYRFKVGNNNGVEEENLRHATEAEIKAATVKSFKFGEVEFLIHGGLDYAKTVYGAIYKSEIKEALDYIDNPPSLKGYKLTIHKISNPGGVCLNDEPQCTANDIQIGFGCQQGKLSELKAIYEAFE